MQNASLRRRFGAILYDGLLVFALLALGTLPFIALRGGEYVEAGDTPHQFTMLVIAYVFYAWFWSHQGRTLGMLSWRLLIETPDGKRPGLGQATIRFFAAIISWLPAGLGFWWQLWDRDRLTWHDRMSGTRLVYYPKEDA